MEDIDETGMGGLETEASLTAIDTKFGPEENRVKEIILEQLQIHKPDDASRGNDDKASEKATSAGIKAKLDDEFGGNWNVVVGEVFVTCLSLLPYDRYGFFKAQTFNILVFETSGERAA